jgi:hypothetical protein
MPHPAERAAQSVFWNRKKSAAGNLQPTRGEAAFIKMFGTRLSGRALSSRRGIGDETG